MSKIQIQSKAVEHNINLFKKVMHRYEEKEQKKKEAIIRAFIHCDTGMMRFAELDALNKKEWRAIEIRIDLNAKDVSFSGDVNQGFSYSDLDALAKKVMTETFGVLKRLIVGAKTLNELSFVEFELTSMKSAGGNLIHEAWHLCTRAEAEGILEKEGVGAYLFRQDEYASIIEKELSESLGAVLRCITLSYLDKDQVVRDMTLIYRDGKWFVYDDDPTLSGKAYGEISQILQERVPHPFPISG